MKIKIRYMIVKKGNYYWQPDKILRAKGYRAIALGKDFSEASRRASELNTELDQARNSIPAHSPAGILNPQATLNDFWLAYRNSRGYKNLAARTKKDYNTSFDKKIAPWAGGKHPKLISRADVQTWYTYLLDKADSKNQTYHTANHALSALSVVMSFVHNQGQIAANPAKSQRKRSAKPRTIRFTDDELDHLVTTADRMGIPSIGDAIMIAVYTALRQADIIDLSWLNYQSGRIRRVSNKTGVTIDVPATDILKARLVKAQERASVGCSKIIRHENTCKPYGADNFRHRFALVRAEAAKGMPDIADKQFMDLRDTAITKLAEAGCTAIQISAVSGHSINSVNTILKHYVVTGASLADIAIAKLQQAGKF